MLGDDHLLRLNPARVIRCLKGILDAQELASIQSEIDLNVGALLRLAIAHRRFAAQVTGRLSWRQSVSRAYYACYTASRAVRLSVYGVYETDVSDHKKVGNLPEDFADSATWQDLLTKFRADRNLADYDHTALQADLELSVSDYLTKTDTFLTQCRTSLRNRGVNL
jgi:uncharacterized protein (UPF0332 family)